MESTKIYSRRQNIIVLGVIAFINALFLLKYLARYVHHAEIYTVIYIVLILAGYWLWESKKVNIPATFILILTGLFVLAFIVILQKIPAEKLNVDRWSVIYSFWETMLQGKYPYSAQSHMGNFPGPLPVYFILAFPFYAIKEIGYMPLIASVGFILYVLKKGKTENSNYSFSIILLLTSPCIYWEIIARSTLFFFSFLWLIYAEWFLNKELDDKKQIMTTGLLGGLLLSTRFIYAMLLALWAIYLWRSGKSIARIVGWATIVAGVFALTIIPLWLIFPAEFAQFNPFKTESSSFVPLPITLFSPASLLLVVFFAKTSNLYSSFRP